jgi:hypothetical protein
MKYLSDKILQSNYLIDSWQYEKNNIHPFIQTDTKERWLQNVKFKSNNDSLRYYIDNPIEYKLNNAGFRTPDNFNNNEYGNVFLGCSHTYGTGLHLKDLWSYKLNNVIGGKFWNLGLPSTGVASHFRLLLGYCKELKIKNIFHFAPMYPRYEFIENGAPTGYIVNFAIENWKETFGNLMQNSLITDEQCEMNWLSYTYAIKGLANEIGANYYLIEGDTGMHNEGDNSLQARDLMHHTTKVHHTIYQDFLKIYDIDLYEKYKDTQEPIFDIKEYMEKKKTKKNNLL